MTGSGLEMLEEILRKVNALEAQMKVMDQNIKRIANTARIAEMATKAAGTPLADWSTAIAPKPRAVVSAEEEIKKARAKIENKRPMQFKFEQTDASKMGGPAAASHKNRAVPKTIMCKGKMLVDSGDGELPLSGLSVKIFDSTDKIVKETKTNRAGHWMSQLAPGKYVALYEGEYDGTKLVPVNKNFEVPDSLEEGQKFVEVV